MVACVLLGENLQGCSWQGLWEGKKENKEEKKGRNAILKAILKDVMWMRHHWAQIHHGSGDRLIWTPCSYGHHAHMVTHMKWCFWDTCGLCKGFGLTFLTEWKWVLRHFRSFRGSPNGSQSTTDSGAADVPLWTLDSPVFQQGWDDPHECTYGTDVHSWAGDSGHPLYSMVTNGPFQTVINCFRVN